MPSSFAAVRNSASGRWAVLFDGAQVPCLADADCPGFAYCYDNVSYPWLDGGPTGSTCCCSVSYGLTGPMCADVSPSGIGLFVFCLVTALVLVWPICANSIAWYRVRNLRFSESIVFKASLLLNVAGSLALFGRMIQVMCEIAVHDPPASYRLNIDFNTAFSFLILFFHGTAFINIAIVWLEASDSAVIFFKTSLFAYQAKYFKYILYATNAIFILLSLIFLIRGNVTTFALVGAVLIALVIVLYLRGYLRLRRVLRDILALNSRIEANAEVPSDVNQKVFAALQSVCKTALWASLAALCALIPIIVYSVALGGSNGGDTPGVAAAGLTVHVGWFFLALTSFILATYLSSVSKARYKAAAKITTGISVPVSHTV